MLDPGPRSLVPLGGHPAIVSTVVSRSSSLPPSGVDDDRPVDLYKLAACTTLYSLVEGAITYPYDLIKTQQQASPSGSLATRVTTSEYVHALIRERGPASLY